MEIKVLIGKSEHVLRGSGFTFELCKFKNSIDKKTSKPIGWTAYRFYSSLESAINDILRGKLSASDANSFTELKSELTKAKDELRGYYENI